RSNAFGDAALPLPATNSSSLGSESPGITPELTTVEGDDSFRLLVFTLPLRDVKLGVFDSEMTRPIDEALKDGRALLAFNGGFFDKSDRPEGLVLAQGHLISPASPTLGGGVLAVGDEKGALFRVEEFVASPSYDFAIQARPRLVVENKSVIVKDDA